MISTEVGCESGHIGDDAFLHFHDFFSVRVILIHGADPEETLSPSDAPDDNRGFPINQESSHGVISASRLKLGIGVGTVNTLVI